MSLACFLMYPGTEVSSTQLSPAPSGTGPGPAPVPDAKARESRNHMMSDGLHEYQCSYTGTPDLVNHLDHSRVNGI